MKTENAWPSYTKKDEDQLNTLIEGYKDYLFKGKTEREGNDYIVALAKKHGYKDLDSLVKAGKKLKAGDKVYASNMGKTVAMFEIGSEDLEDGMNILGAHIDSPRLDVKQNPLYEDTDLAYFDTHYYGGIKKYQWVTLPLAIHGVVVKADGTKINVVIGEEDNDPVFCVTDILIHLADSQMTTPAGKAVKGEALDLLVGSRPIKFKKDEKDKSDAVSKNLLAILKKKYNFDEKDLLSAELEVVPAGKPRDMGIDSSMVIAYGQDDKVCAYTSLIAQLNVTKVKRTTCTLLCDKEEIGSVGATGMQSRFFENCVAEILALLGKTGDLPLRRCLKNSFMLSSDVSAGYDPLYADRFEKKNASLLGHGMVFNKFTGSRGKSGSNDANAEYVAKIRGIMEKDKVFYQTAELGKVDVGGGGTIAYILSLYDMEVIDCGVAVLNMHAPWEVTSKADIYETEKGYEAFLKNA
ncbi:MAG: aminopeptidase [Lachnospiraceae bacterium]|nr:aminopeptidase [Lachnospiraceae bacterium]